ncbi:hypothetical protein PHISP_02092 [Aspergillus sp. HF37]|nr:hypothetical protein PHISP_02092 [Aspergillus sp. HF37]
MDSTVARPFDDSLRDPPQLQSLRIAPLRQPVSSRTLSVPSPLEPNASGVRESNTGSKTNPSSSATPATLPTLTELLDAARTKKNDSSVDSMLSLEPPPKPILPAFVNLRALERFPFSSFDDSSHARKRRRLEVQTDYFGEHLHLPIPQAQKEQKPPPFGPFAILNGLNEPPPNAALLPPIEAGSIPQLLNRPTKDDSTVEPSVPAISADGQNAEKREGKIEEILGSPLGDKASDLDRNKEQEEPKGNGYANLSEPENAKCKAESGQPQRGEWRDGSLSPKPRGRSRKNTRKWTEEETIDLLRGVVKCGIGNWKAILAQPDLKFDKRTASNLKDRTTDPNEATRRLHDTLSQAVKRFESKCSDGSAGKKSKSHSGSVHSSAEQSSLQGSPVISSNELLGSSTSTTATHGINAAKDLPSESNSARLSQSKIALESLGVPEPDLPVACKRRNRYPFTAAEDESLLKGYAVHGFQWALIQRDKRLNLGHRKSTDLRDRFRNKFPDVYRHGGSVSGNTLQGQSPHADGNSKATATDRQKPAGNGHKRTASSNNEVRNANQFTPRTMDPGFSPLAPPQTHLPDASSNLPSVPGSIQLLLDDHPTGASDTPLEDNTLPPLVWDELPD